MPTLQAEAPGKNASKRLKKSVQKHTRTSNLPTLQHFIDTAYQKELKIFHESGKQLQVGDAVIARMKGYAPWPGRIQSVSSNNKIMNCYFFGTHNSGPVGSKNIMPFSLAVETVRLVCLRSPKMYIKGVREIEIVYGVPEELSCLNELKSIQ